MDDKQKTLKQHAQDLAQYAIDEAHGRYGLFIFTNVTKHATGEVITTIYDPKYLAGILTIRIDPHHMDDFTHEKHQVNRFIRRAAEKRDKTDDMLTRRAL